MVPIGRQSGTGFPFFFFYTPWSAVISLRLRYSTLNIKDYKPKNLVSVSIRSLLSGQHALAGLREVVPQALEFVKGSLICGFWERTQRILKAYREGAMFGDEAYKQRVYKSHRRVQVHRERDELIN